MPDFTLEGSAAGRVAGVDEAGRGPLAGPVLAAAVVFRAPPPAALAGLIDDSKRLPREARERAFRALTGDAVVEIGVGAASVTEIAALNILGATLLAMCRAVARLPKPPDLALIDGNVVPTLACPARAVVGGDQLSLSIAAASIIAKVLRDRGMRRLSARFPGYGWEQNAGYATPAHLEAIGRLGATRHHRLGFGELLRVARVCRS
ncbi:MAG: ribonuclease HII [Acetobacteraceae bacterium]